MPHPRVPSFPVPLWAWIPAALLLAGSLGAACSSGGPNQADAAPPAECVLGEFDCGTGTECIAADAVCDGEENCSNGADEQNCGCGAGLFECDDGQCIHAAFVCDLVVNCADGSDEEGCP